MQKLIFEEKIYTYQIDFVGHVSNIVYIQWLEHGRMHMLEKMGYPVDNLAANDGVMPVLTETCISYKIPLYLNNKAKIEMWVSKLNNASAIMEFRIYNEKGGARRRSKKACSLTGRPNARQEYQKISGRSLKSF